MAYQNIQNYPDNAGDLGSTELGALSTVWRDKKDELEQTGVFQEFLKKMQREWAIETGIIERLYTWDRGVTEILIDQDIYASLIAHQGGIPRQEADHIKHVIDDQLEIVEGLFSFIKAEQPLTQHFIRGLQAQFTKHQDTTEAMPPDGKLVQVTLEKGVYKKHPNNPRRPDGQEHFYCPPEQTEFEMQNLVAWYRDSEQKYTPEVRAAWLHHRFTQIHPFQDGNGRVARALASLIFLKEGLFPLVIRDSDRKEYIGALEKADSGDIQTLIGLFVRRQKEVILHALGLGQQVQQGKYVEQIISSALKELKGRSTQKTRKWRLVSEYAEEISNIGKTRLDEVSKSINIEFSEMNSSNKLNYKSSVSESRISGVRYYFNEKIHDIAEQFKYFANINQYHEWLRLSIETEQIFEFIVSIHGYGHTGSEIIAVSAFTGQRIQGKTDSALVNFHLAITDIFQFNYAEPLDSTKQRFTEWLESSLAMGLAEWKRQVSA